MAKIKKSGTHERLLADIENFLQETGMSESTFGVGALNDGALVGDLKKGRRVTLDTYDKITAFMAQNAIAGQSLPSGGN